MKKYIILFSFSIFILFLSCKKKQDDVIPSPYFLNCKIDNVDFKAESASVIASYDSGDGSYNIQGNVGGASGKVLQLFISGGVLGTTYNIYGFAGNTDNLANYIANFNAYTTSAIAGSTKIGEVKITGKNNTDIEGTFYFNAKSGNNVSVNITMGSFKALIQ